MRDGCATDSGLRFDDSVPVKVADVLPDELKGANADYYDIISYKTSYRLAQKQASFVVIKERRPVIQEKATKKLITTPAPARVFDNSLADVSFLAGMLVDKFLYRLPLHRQHQRLAAAGITLSRSLLTQLTAKAIALLKPVVDAQYQNVLLSQALALDKTPIKAGRKGPGKMKQGYFWPMYGDQGEMVFRYCSSRSDQHLAPLNAEITHAQCWAHTRRCFERALTLEPEAAGEALAMIGALYRHEEQIRNSKLTGWAKKEYRQIHSTPVVDTFWLWCKKQCQRLDLTPTNPLSNALNYAMSRVESLEVFLTDPDVAIDTNHLERGLRPIPMGKKAWLFCWTESGAEDVAAIQSLLTTCRIHNVNAYTYLVDVLQRVSVHPASQVQELTPRVWKRKFSENPMRSVVESVNEY